MQFLDTYQFYFTTSPKRLHESSSFSSQHQRQDLLQWRSVTASGPAESMERWGKMEQLGRVAVRSALVWWVTIISADLGYHILCSSLLVHIISSHVFFWHSVVSHQLLCSKFWCWSVHKLSQFINFYTINFLALWVSVVQYFTLSCCTILTPLYCSIIIIYFYIPTLLDERCMISIHTLEHYNALLISITIP